MLCQQEHVYYSFFYQMKDKTLNNYVSAINDFSLFPTLVNLFSINTVS